MAVRRFFISNKWRYPKVIIVLFVLEFLFTVPALALFAVADPDTYRDRLREDGYMNGFNSNPNAALYAIANHQPYTAPLVWSTFITSFNVVIAVFSVFLLLIKAVMFILHIWWPALSLIIHGILTAVWALSTNIQSMPDLSDPTHLQKGAPWYITKSCSISYYPSNKGYCQQAKACFIITVILTSLFGLNSAWAIFSMVPTRKERIARQRRYNDDADSDYDSDDSDDDVGERPKSRSVGEKDGKDEVEMQQMPENRKAHNAFKTPMTPRTRAYNRLGGDYYG